MMAASGLSLIQWRYRGKLEQIQVDFTHSLHA